MQQRRQHTSEQALELLQQQRDLEERRKIELGRKELMRYRFRHNLLYSNKQDDIFPLVKVAVPDFIKAGMPPIPRKDQYQDLRVEVLGEVESEGIANMMNDKRLNEAMTASANLRKSLERKRLAKASTPQELMVQVDNIVEGLFRENTNTAEKNHVALNKIPHLLRELSGERVSSARNMAECQIKFKDSKKDLKQDQLKVLLRNRKGGLSARLNREIKIPTLEEVERRKKSLIRRKKVLQVKTPDAMKKRNTNRFSSCSREKYVIEGFEQLCSAADSLASAYSQNCGTVLLEKYRQAFHPRKRRATPGYPIIAQKLANSENTVKGITGKAKQLSNALEQGVHNIGSWIEEY